MSGLARMHVDQAETLKNPPDVGVNSEDLAAQRVRHNASRRLRADTGERLKELQRLGVIEVAEEIEAQGPVLTQGARVTFHGRKEARELGCPLLLESRWPQNLDKDFVVCAEHFMPAVRERFDEPLEDRPVDGCSGLDAQKNVDGLIKAIVEVAKIGRPVLKFQQLADAADDAGSR